MSLFDKFSRGTFSEVRLGTNKTTGERFAVKIMTKEEDNPRKKEIIDVEIEILKRVDHPNVTTTDICVGLLVMNSFSAGSQIA